MTLLPTVAVGTLVAVRRPGNALGWLLLGAGLFFSVNSGAVAYSVLDYRLHHGTLPLGRVALALQPAWAAGLVMIAGCLWLFPDGHLPSGRWRRVGGILFGAGLVYGALTFVPSVIAAAAPSLRVATDGTPGAIENPGRDRPALAGRRECGLLRAGAQLRASGSSSRCRSTAGRTARADSS